MLQSVISGKTLQEQLITLPVIFGRLDLTNMAIMQGEGGMILLWTQGWYDTVSALEGGGLVFWPGKIQFSRFFHESLYLRS